MQDRRVTPWYKVPASLRARTVAGTMLLAWAIVLFFGALNTGRSLAADANKSFDPWSPDRKFCGRLVIHIVGAGNVYQDPSKPDADQDVLSKYTLANLEGFAGPNETGLPTISILITSDATLKKRALALSERAKTNSQFVIVPASADAFEEFLSDDVTKSALETAIAQFAAKESCKGLMGPEESVLRYLKTEIVIESEHTPGGIPLWNSKADDGLIDKWSTQDNPKVIDSDLISNSGQSLARALSKFLLRPAKAQNSDGSCRLETNALALFR